jgi:outer membrane protein TolC
MMRQILVTKLILLLFFHLGFTASLQASSVITPYTLDQAISLALQNNRLRTISRQSLQIAEAQYKQAVSSYWPTLSLNMGFQRRDEPSNFEYPAQQFDVMPGLIPPVNVPAQQIDLLGRNTARNSLEITYPLYTGGKRSSLIEQAKIGVDIAQQEIRRTNLQVVQDVKRYYYAALYTQNLVTLAEDITLSFEVLEDITETFFEQGSYSVDKLDLLRSRLAHTMAEATLAELKSKHKAALSALSFTMGLDWQEEISLSGEDYPLNLESEDLDRMVEQALNFNPEIEKLALAVEAYNAKVDEAKSGHYPTLALMGSINSFNTNLDGGLDTEENRRSWTIGIGLKMNLFEGGRIRHKVSAAKTGKRQIEQQHLLISESVATRIKSLFLQTQASQQQIEITQRSLQTSTENRSLNNRAYQTGAVDTQKVIEADLLDAMIRANHYRARHDHALHLSEITYLLGKEAVK